MRKDATPVVCSCEAEAIRPGFDVPEPGRGVDHAIAVPVYTLAVFLEADVDDRSKASGILIPITGPNVAV